jgi:hypothetical protein
MSELKALIQEYCVHQLNNQLVDLVEQYYPEKSLTLDQKNIVRQFLQTAVNASAEKIAEEFEQARLAISPSNPQLNQ